jgi:hypothetical protein
MFWCICISIFATNQLKLHFILLDQQLRTCQHSARCCIKLLLCLAQCHQIAFPRLSFSSAAHTTSWVCSMSMLASPLWRVHSTRRVFSFLDISYLLQIYLLSWISNVCYKFIHFPGHQMSCHKFNYGKVSFICPIHIKHEAILHFTFITSWDDESWWKCQQGAQDSQ